MTFDTPKRLYSAAIYRLKRETHVRVSPANLCDLTLQFSNYAGIEYRRKAMVTGNREWQE
jgi:hypothetical protein